jgi:hypothetical protein
MPTISTPGSTAAGDMTGSLFFSPSHSTGTVWGVGPVLVLPRTRAKWGIGPTAVLVRLDGNRTWGALVNHVWSFAGDDDAPDLNQTFLQPFFAVSTANAVTFTIQSEMVANWEAADGDEWTVPLNVLVSKVAKIGPFPASFGAGPGVYLVSPDAGPEWRLRGVVTLMLPSSK